MKRYILSFILVSQALAGALAGGCAAPLATLPPNDTYTVVEGAPPQLTGDEKKLVDDINKELTRLGLPQAVVGSYETNVAALMANAGLAKVWSGSGRALTKDNRAVIQGPVSDQESAESKHEVANGRLASLSDEQANDDIKHLHVGQRLSARGIPHNLRTYVYKAQLAQTEVEGEDLRRLVRHLHPDQIHGQLTIGVAILSAGDAGDRIFSVALRDRSYDLIQAPPRFPTPGSTFTLAGTVIDRSIKNMRIALMSPNASVELTLIPVDGQGNFSANLTIPAAPGLYVLSLARAEGGAEDTLTVPLFAGVPPSPWPVSADPKATSPLSGTRTVAQRLANAIADYRRSHGLADLPIDAKLSAFAKGEAALHAKAEDDQAGAATGTPQQQLDTDAPARITAAGYAPNTLIVTWNVWSDDYLNDFFARFPNGPFSNAVLNSTSAQLVGIGVALVPNDVTKDSDLVRYALVYAIQDPTPPQPVERKSDNPAAPLPEGVAPGATDPAAH